MRSLAGSRPSHVRPLQISSRRVVYVKAAGVSGSDIPRSFESSVSQACHSVRTSLFGGKKSKSRRVKSLRRLSVEIPTLDTSVENSLFLTTELLKALQGSGKSGVTVLYSDTAILEAAKKELSNTAAVHIDNAADSELCSRLIVFQPTPQKENILYELLDDVWRGEVVLLFNPEFSDDFKAQKASFVQAFETVYCFMPLAIKVFIQNKDGALFRWQKDKGSDAKWLIFIEDGQQFKQIGQQVTRPTQNELETAIYNATAAESPITKGLEFFGKFGKKK